MKEKVYIETTIPSYLTAWPSRDLLKEAHQQITREWWRTRSRFDLYISPLVLKEAQLGDVEAAELRLDSLTGIRVLSIDEKVTYLTGELIAHSSLPKKAATDAAHIAFAVVNGMDYLLTWNCRHIANAMIRLKIENICRRNGYEPTLLCTPSELLEEPL